MCPQVSPATLQQPTIPTIVSGDDRITDDAVDAIADFLLDRWFAQQTQPLRDAESLCEPSRNVTVKAQLKLSLHATN